MNGPRDCHTEWSKLDREKQIWYHLNVESKKMVQMNLFINRNRVTYVENKLMVTRGEKGRGINWEIGIEIYTHYYI